MTILNPTPNSALPLSPSLPSEGSPVPKQHHSTILPPLSSGRAPGRARGREPAGAGERVLRGVAAGPRCGPQDLRLHLHCLPQVGVGKAVEGAGGWVVWG